MKSYDIVIVGGSIGGVIAAYSAAKTGKKVLLIEKTKWIGGQFTSQAVPPDEHPFIESFGSTASYRKFRDSIRAHMMENYPILPHVKNIKYWNPGHASVSRLSAPPKVILHLLNEMLKPYIENEHITLLLEHVATDAIFSKEQIKSLTIKNIHANQTFDVTGSFFLDATDTGDLLPLTQTDYVVGAESKSQTKEPNALDIANSKDMQPITWVAAVDYVEGEDHTIEKPEMYDYYKNLLWPCDDTRILSWYGPDSMTGKTKEFGMFDNQNRGLFPLWSYRRIIDPKDFEKGTFNTEVTLLNWPQNDYIFHNIFDTENDEIYADQAKQLTLSLLYWLQTEALRPDGQIGYPGIRLRPDILGTDDGLAMAPYIRESRRIKAMHTITEHRINANLQNELPHEKDSIGVGSYHIDLHMTTVSNRFFFFKTWPFEIPLGAMIPIDKLNLIPACKNIGTTQLTNGCFRLHPVEWNIGEVAGYLAAKSIEWQVNPKEIYLNNDLLQKFQAFLDIQGIERSWPEDQVHVI